MHALVVAGGGETAQCIEHSSVVEQGRVQGAGVDQDLAARSAEQTSGGSQRRGEGFDGHRAVEATVHDAPGRRVCLADALREGN